MVLLRKMDKGAAITRFEEVSFRACRTKIPSRNYLEALRTVALDFDS